MRDRSAATSRRRLLGVLAVVAIANLAIFLAQVYLFVPFRVPSISMVPTLERGDRVLVDRNSKFGDVERGDLIVFRASATRPDGTRFNARDGDDDSDAFIIKRVIALPGDSIQGGQQRIAIDNTELLDEPYARWEDDDSRFGPETVDTGTVWVMGDNRAHSVDSRQYGTVPRAAFVGKAVGRYWPPSRIGGL